MSSPSFSVVEIRRAGVDRTALLSVIRSDYVGSVEAEEEETTDGKGRERRGESRVRERERRAAMVLLPWRGTCLRGG